MEFWFRLHWISLIQRIFTLASIPRILDFYIISFFSCLVQKSEFFSSVSQLSNLFLRGAYFDILPTWNFSFGNHVILFPRSLIIKTTHFYFIDNFSYNSEVINYTSFKIRSFLLYCAHFSICWFLYFSFKVLVFLKYFLFLVHVLIFTIWDSLFTHVWLCLFTAVCLQWFWKGTGWAPW